MTDCPVCGSYIGAIASDSDWRTEADRIRFEPCGHRFWLDPSSPNGLVQYTPNP